MGESAVSGDKPSSSKQAVLEISCIPIVNKVQGILEQLGISSTIYLPQVAVVGIKSSGKSSVLEALIGRDILPRATRCPLLLELVNISRRPDAEKDWGEFAHVPSKQYYEFSEIRGEIEAQTDREALGNKGVSDKQILLKIFSPNVPNITLVDLPGITKVPVGDQPSDIEARIRTMILSYIKPKNCIILAVLPANADLSNSDALQMTRIADPNGFRTIGVITKLDLMDRGADACNFLLGNVIPLRLGYVGVVNRSQRDINLNRSIDDALANEEEFFRHHPVYHGLSHCCGVPKLAKKLNQILVQHIQSVLPELKSHINSQLEVATKEHTAYGDVVKSMDDQGSKLFMILAKYCEAFNSMIEEKNEESLIGELSGVTLIHSIFQKIFVKSLEEVDPCEDVSDEDIRKTIQGATGPKGALPVPEVPFKVLVRGQIGRLLDPSLQCAKLIYDELTKMSNHSLTNELNQYPFLRKRMDKVITNFLREGFQQAETMITHLIETEMDYINISHPNFIGENKAVEIAQQQVKASRLATSVSRRKGVQPPQDSDRLGSPGNPLRKIYMNSPISGRLGSGSSSVSGRIGGILSIFGVSKNRAKSKEISFNNPASVPSHNVEHSLSMIQPQEPPVILKPSENQSEQEALGISSTKLLLKSYYDIVRIQIEDIVPKQIMHFFVNHTKRKLLNVFMSKLFSENYFDDLFREADDMAAKRKRIKEKLGVLKQAYKTLNELPLEADPVEMGFSLDSVSAGLPKVQNPSASINSTSSDYMSPCTASS